MSTDIEPRFDRSQITEADIEYQRNHRNMRNWFWYFIVGGLILLPALSSLFGTARQRTQAAAIRAAAHHLQPPEQP